MIAVAGALKSTLGLGGALEVSAFILIACAFYLSRIQLDPRQMSVPTAVTAT